MRRLSVAQLGESASGANRWMRVSPPNQLSVPKAFLKFDEIDRMNPAALYDRLVDIMVGLIKVTLLLHERQQALFQSDPAGPAVTLLSQHTTHPMP